MKLLTIIVPVYNAEKYVRRCLDSILCQCTPEYEALLINDGSRDQSLSILREYGERFSDIVRVIDQENRGAAATRNRGIQEAKGKYLCFVDNDDFVDSDYFTRFLTCMEKPNCDMVIGGYRRVSDKEVKFEVFPKQVEWYKYMIAAPWAKIYRRDFLLKNQIQFLEYGLGEDVFFSMTAYAASDHLETLDYVGYNWFYNEESVSNTSQRGFNPKLDPCYLLERIYEKVGKRNIYCEYFYVRYAVWYLLFSGKAADARSFEKEYRRLFAWLNDKKIPLRFPVFTKKVPGESWSVCLAVNLLLVLHKFHMVSLFAKLYCRGKVDA